MGERIYLGVDVGTGSVRAGLFDAAGKRHGTASHPIQIFRPEEDFAEHSSDDIWRAVGEAVRGALRDGGVKPSDVRGIGFDATCSLVVLGGGDAPVSVSPTGKPEQNVIVWMDHRAVDQARRINETRHDVLRFVGGVISPEMQSPKLLWLKENMRDAFDHARRFFDLPDYLVYRATGSDVRSLCSTVCKWNYRGKEGTWDESFFGAIGLADIGLERIGSDVRAVGERAGSLNDRAALELGLTPGIPVGVSMIDAHAGGLGLLGATVAGRAPTPDTMEQRLALIGGTSSCHMAVSREPKFLNGIWGPYWSAMLPGLWLTEGGQSATGALLDHVVFSHARGAELRAEADRRGTHPYSLLNDRLAALAEGSAFPAALAKDTHVFPDFHGNRSPRADPTLRGMVSGLRLSDTIDSLALVYLATIQAIAHGTKHIVDTMNAGGYSIDTLFACGGDIKNPVFVREHADVTGCRIVLPSEPEAVLLGSSILGGVASGDFESVLDAMAAMNHAETIAKPSGGAVEAFHEKKHKVFARMYEDQMAYRALMA